MYVSCTGLTLNLVGRRHRQRFGLPSLAISAPSALSALSEYCNVSRGTHARKLIRCAVRKSRGWGGNRTEAGRRAPGTVAAPGRRGNPLSWRSGCFRACTDRHQGVVRTSLSWLLRACNSIKRRVRRGRRERSRSNARGGSFASALSPSRAAQCGGATGRGAGVAGSGA